MLATHFEELSPVSKHMRLVDVGGPLKSDEGVYAAVLDRLADMDDALQEVTYFYLGLPSFARFEL